MMLEKKGKLISLLRDNVFSSSKSEQQQRIYLHTYFVKGMYRGGFII